MSVADHVNLVKLEHPLGRYIGVFGAGGKSTLASAIARKYDLAFIELDEIQHMPGSYFRGYSRWLHRARVSASLNESSIDGKFADGLSSEQVLDGVRIACDMIRQRFELYQESVLG